MTFPEPEGRFFGYDLSSVGELGRVRAAVAGTDPVARCAMMDFDDRDLAVLAEKAGFDHIHVECHLDIGHREGSPAVSVDALLDTAPNPNAPTARGAIAAALRAPEQVQFVTALGSVTIRSSSAAARSRIASSGRVGVRAATGGLTMPMFVTIGYGDRDGYDRTDQAVRDAAHAHDARLVKSGAIMGVAGTPVQVRNHDAAGVRTEKAPFLHASLPVAGFALIEAASMDEAVALVSQTPCAVAHCVVEVWPLEQTL